MTRPHPSTTGGFPAGEPGHLSWTASDPTFLAGGISVSRPVCFLPSDVGEVAPSFLEEPTKSLSEGQPIECGAGGIDFKGSTRPDHHKLAKRQVSDLSD